MVPGGWGDSRMDVRYEDWPAKKVKLGANLGMNHALDHVLKQTMRFPVSFIRESDPFWALF